MSYTIKLEAGKYLVRNDNGSLTILRHGEPWPAAEDLKHVAIVLALAQRIEELEETIRAVVDGEPDERGVRGCKALGTGHYFGAGSVGTMALADWDATLRKVLAK